MGPPWKFYPLLIGMGGSFPLEMRREWGQFHSSPTRTPLFSELNAVLHLVLVQDGVCWLLLRHATAWDSQAQKGPQLLHQAFVKIRQPGPSWPFTSGVYGCLFLVLSWLSLVLKGFSWHVHEGKAAWGPDRSSRGYRRLRPHLSSPRGMVGPRCPA